MAANALSKAVDPMLQLEVGEFFGVTPDKISSVVKDSTASAGTSKDPQMSVFFSPH